MEAQRQTRRAASRRRVHRQRRLAALAVLGALVIVLVIASSGGSSSNNAHRPSHASHRAPVIVAGGPLAPAAVGGLASLWAPQNVVGTQPGTAAAYGAASKLSGPA
jgi:hypothetical protein